MSEDLQAKLTEAIAQFETLKKQQDAEYEAEQAALSEINRAKMAQARLHRALVGLDREIVQIRWLQRLEASNGKI